MTAEEWKKVDEALTSVRSPYVLLKIDGYKVIMSSMTKKEMENPKLIKQSRIRRIAMGAGVEESEVRDLLKYYNNTKKTMKGIGKRGRFGNNSMNRMMGQFMK